MPDLQIQQQQTELQLRDDQQQQQQQQQQPQQHHHHHHHHHQEYQRKSSILEDPNAAPIPTPNQNVHLNPRAVYLRDHVSIATIHPVTHPSLIPASLVAFLLGQFNEELERGDTYPLDQPMTLEQFEKYWFGTFAAVMLMGGKEETSNLLEERDWATQCLGTFYIKPNYPGRSSHVCSGGFLTTHASRGKGCGKHMGEAYLEYAPKLGFTYSIFNLVYETNTASLKIWDGLGFKRIGKVKGAGRLRGHTQPVDAVIYGRDLNDDDDYVSDERFDKIRFYLEKGKYPPTADRSEKSRLRSAATHYKLDNGRLMLKDKEVISDGQMQYEIARSVHCQAHGGINKTTASIAEKYHWVRIKETVSQVIRNCAECKEHAKAPVVRGERFSSERSQPSSQQLQNQEAARAANIAQAAQMDIPVDPAMMEDVQHTHQFAPVANMNPSPEESAAAGQTPQHAAAVAAARAALNEGDALTEEDRTMRDRHLMETLMAEMKREPAAEAAVVAYQETDVEREVERQLQAGMEIERQATMQ